MPSVIGTTCAAVIQSSPSRKFTALTNHTVPSTSSARSTTGGSRSGNRRKSAGRLATMTSAASVWPIKRHDTGSARASSASPSTVNPAAATSTGHSGAIPPHARPT